MVFMAIILHFKHYPEWETTWANEMKFGMTHAQGAGSIV